MHILKFFVGLIVVMIVAILIRKQISLNVISITFQCIGYAVMPFVFSLPLLIGLSKLRDTSYVIEGFFVIVLLREIDWLILNEQFAMIIVSATTFGTLIVGLVLLVFVCYKKI